MRQLSGIRSSLSPFGCAITAEIKKDRNIYCHCTFDKGSCGGQYVREEELERQFEDILGEFQFSEALLDWMRDALRQSQKEKAEYHRRAIEKLNAQYSKLQNRIDQIYLDKLDGEVEEAFYRRNVSAWREEQAQIRDPDRTAREGGPELHRAGDPAPGAGAERAGVLPDPRPGRAGGAPGLHPAGLNARPGQRGPGPSSLRSTSSIASPRKQKRQPRIPKLPVQFCSLGPTQSERARSTPPADRRRHFSERGKWSDARWRSTAGAYRLVRENYWLRHSILSYTSFR